ncbi:uncharacterized protein LOC114730293 [Neltuma alba]|uniref:uncharacterized protein LOC114730293 n=1 Tax=Neltuma alba TaxID=207710 RepID=UPI0010A31A88|nr:uncharacterized protein LOC114730293 [Prosopis alba]
MNNQAVQNPSSNDQGAKETSCMQDQWKVVQKTRRQRKPKEKQGEASNHANSGSRFNILINEEDNQEEKKDNGETHQMSTEDGMTATKLTSTRQQRPLKTRAGKEKKGTTVTKYDKKKESEGVARPLLTDVRQSSRAKRVEKRTRDADEALPRQNDEVLMITMGENNTDGQNEDMEFERNDVDPAGEMETRSGEKTKNSHSNIPIDPGEMEIAEEGDIRIGPVDNSPYAISSQSSEQSGDIIVPETQMVFGP